MKKIILPWLVLIGTATMVQGQQTKTDKSKGVETSDKATPAEEAEIRALVEQLVVKEGVNRNTCRAAFYRIMKFKKKAFPILLEHLKDERKSVPFRNHYLGFKVGNACYWNIYLQLVDRPNDYSRYGLSRTGKDLKDHTQPAWDGDPFGGSVEGMQKWFKQHKDLNYEEMQIKALTWMLDKELEIGAPDAESYFLNIHPLKVRIMEIRRDNGEDVAKELKELREMRDKVQADKIPKDLLPDK